MSHVLATRAGNLELRGANPTLEWGNSSPPPPGSIGGNVGGLAVTTESATQVAAVYGCCALLADSVASLPLRVLDAPITKTTAKEVKLPLLLQRPWEPISLTDWLVMFIWSLALRGNFFGQIIERDDMGYPLQIMPLSPDLVRHRVTLNGELKWEVAGKPIPTEDLFHVRYQSMPGQVLGLNPIQCMKHPFGLAHVLDIHAETTFRNGAAPGMVIKAKGKVSEATLEQWIKRWEGRYQGVRQSSLPAILTEDADIMPISISPEDQQLLESRKYSAEEISGLVFRIPPHMVGLNERSTSFGRGIEQQERGFVANTLSGYLCRASRSLTDCLPPNRFVDFDISHRIRGSELERAQTVSLLALAGQIVPNEGRGKWFDMPPRSDGDQLYSPINTELLKQALAEAEKAEKDLKEPPPDPEPPQLMPAQMVPAKGKQPVVPTK